jgi:hypothetical protein
MVQKPLIYRKLLAKPASGRKEGRKEGKSKEQRSSLCMKVHQLLQLTAIYYLSENNRKKWY